MKRIESRIDFPGNETFVECARALLITFLRVPLAVAQSLKRSRIYSQLRVLQFGDESEFNGEDRDERSKEKNLRCSFSDQADGQRASSGKKQRDSRQIVGVLHGRLI